MKLLNPTSHKSRFTIYNKINLLKYFNKNKSSEYRDSIILEVILCIVYNVYI